MENGSLYIGRLIVLPEFQHRGIGKQLLHEPAMNLWVALAFALVFTVGWVPVFLVCLVMLYGLRLAERREMIERVIISLLIILAATFWVIVIRSECGIELVLLTAVLYCFRDKLVIKYVLGIIISLMDAFGPISFCAIIFYSGKRDLRISKYFYYGLYPAHYLIFGLIARCFLIK